jgi:hypothetical protein
MMFVRTKDYVWILLHIWLTLPIGGQSRKNPYYIQIFLTAAVSRERLDILPTVYESS